MAHCMRPMSALDRLAERTENGLSVLKMIGIEVMIKDGWHPDMLTAYEDEAGVVAVKTYLKRLTTEGKLKKQASKYLEMLENPELIPQYLGKQKPEKIA